MSKFKTQNRASVRLLQLLIFALITNVAHANNQKNECKGVLISDDYGQAICRCQGKFSDYKRPGPKELRKVLDNHAAWLQDKNTDRDSSDPRRANLCGANLTEIDLSETRLSFADLSAADLSRADLTSSNLIGADLRAARFDYADLSKAKLVKSDLGGAHLLESDLSHADFRAANFKRVRFEPASLSAPRSFIFGKSLSEMTYIFTPSAMIELRNSLYESGLYKEERAITYAIKHQDQVDKLTASEDRTFTDIVDGIFNFIFFELTTKWGMTPSRALVMLITLIPVFAIPYVIALNMPRKDGIWQKWSNGRMRVDLGTELPGLLRLDGTKSLMFGCYFSLLSAFNIGWRELNVGNWIQRLQTNEYTLHATGWVRTISGIQSLISVYLLAIWALTYFGRPFN